MIFCAGIKNMIIIDLGGGNRIDLSSVRLDIIDTEGNVL